MPEIFPYLIFGYLLAMASTTKPNKIKPANRKPSKQPTKKGWPDVADNIVNKAYSLVASGNLVGLVMIFLVVWVMLVTQRMPTEKIPWFISGIAAYFDKCPWITSLLFLYALIATIIFLSSEKNLRKEIHRLTEIRKELTCGLENATLKHLSEHPESSGYNILE